MSSGSAVVHRVSGVLRLLAATVVLAGVTLALGLQCADGMGMTPVMGSHPTATHLAAGAMTPASVDVVDGHTMDDSQAPGGVAGLAGGAARSIDPDGGLGGMVSACFSLLVMALTAVAVGLGLTRGRRIAGTPPASAMVPGVAIPTGPQLSQLCVLRT